MFIRYHEGSRTPSIREPLIVRPSSAIGENKEKETKERCEGYQHLVKKYLDRVSQESAKPQPLPLNPVKSHVPRSTYADAFTKVILSPNKNTAIHGSAIDCARQQPSIPWHTVSSTNMQNLSKINGMSGGRKLFGKQAVDSTLTVDIKLI